MPRPEPQNIRYAVRADELYLAFEGSATHRISRASEHLALEFLAARPPRPTVVLDLEQCAWLDSTFAGWMIRLQQEVKKADGRVVITHCTPTCRSNLEVLGLLTLFDFAARTPPSDTQQVTCSDPAESDTEMIEFILHAHDDLAHVNADNERVFTPIADSLRRELSKRH